MRKQLYWAALAVLAVSVSVLAGSAMARTSAAPTIRNFTPAQGVLSSQVTIAGTGLSGAMVSFNGGSPVAAQVNRYGNSLVVTVPNNPDQMPVGSHATISVTTPGGTVQATGTFLVTALGSGAPQKMKPTILSISPMKGLPGTKVTIRGNNLGGAQWVKLAGMKTTYVVPKTSKIVVKVPKNAHSGRFSLRTAGGMVTSSMRFAVTGSSKL